MRHLCWRFGSPPLGWLSNDDERKKSGVRFLNVDEVSQACVRTQDGISIANHKAFWLWAPPDETSRTELNREFDCHKSESRSNIESEKKKFSKFKAHRNFLDFVCKTRASYEFFDNLQPLCGTLELSILPFDNRQMTLSDEISRFNSARFLRFLEVFRFYFLGSKRWLRHVAMKTRFFGSVSDELASLTTTTCQWLYSIFLLTFLHWLLFSKSFWCTA